MIYVCELPNFEDSSFALRADTEQNNKKLQRIKSSIYKDIKRWLDELSLYFQEPYEHLCDMLISRLQEKYNHPFAYQLMAYPEMPKAVIDVQPIGNDKHNVTATVTLKLIRRADSTKELEEVKKFLKDNIHDMVGMTEPIARYVNTGH